MKRVPALLSVTCALSVAFAQWVEATIDLPLSIPISMVCNAAGTKLYVTDVNSDSSFVNVIDATNNTWVRKIRCGSSPGTLCYNSEGNKLYVPIPAGTITVIDAVADTVIKDIAIGRFPGLPTYYAAGNRVYCTSYDDQSIVVIDAVADSVLRRIQLPYAAGNLVLNNAEHKLYAPHGLGIEVIDCSADTLGAHIDLPDHALLCLSTVENKLYCASNTDTLFAVVDCSADTILSKTVRVGLWPNTTCYNAGTDKVYCGAYAGQNVTVVDCTTDSALAGIPFPSIPWGICADSVTGNAYCTSRQTDQVFIIDGDGDSLLAVVPVGEIPGTAYWNPVRHRAYIANENGRSISVLRDRPAGVEETPRRPTEAAEANAATVVRGVLFLPASPCPRVSVSPCPRVTASPCLMDVSGRKVLDLHAGANDVSRLSPGVFFVYAGPSAVSRRPSAVTKVVIAR